MKKSRTRQICLGFIIAIRKMKWFFIYSLWKQLSSTEKIYRSWIAEITMIELFTLFFLLLDSLIFVCIFLVFLSELLEYFMILALYSFFVYFCKLLFWRLKKFEWGIISLDLISWSKHVIRLNFISHKIAENSM